MLLPWDNARTAAAAASAAAAARPAARGAAALQSSVSHRQMVPVPYLRGICQEMYASETVFSIICKFQILIITGRQEVEDEPDSVSVMRLAITLLKQPRWMSLPSIIINTCVLRY